jgi:hypothetical protein
MNDERLEISTQERLIAWRIRQGLSQASAAIVFRRCRRMYQYLESGQHLGGVVGKNKLPPDIDDLARLYELTHKKRTKKNAKKSAATA